MNWKKNLIRIKRTLISFPILEYHKFLKYLPLKSYSRYLHLIYRKILVDHFQQLLKNRVSSKNQEHIILSLIALAE